MSTEDTNQKPAGKSELSEDQLDKVAGGKGSSSSSKSSSKSGSSKSSSTKKK